MGTLNRSEIEDLQSAVDAFESWLGSYKDNELYGRLKLLEPFKCQCGSRSWSPQYQRCTTCNERFYPRSGSYIEGLEGEGLLKMIYVVANQPLVSTNELMDICDVSKDRAQKILSCITQALEDSFGGQEFLEKEYKEQISKIRRKGVRTNLKGFISLHALHALMPENPMKYIFRDDQLKPDIERFLFVLALTVREKRPSRKIDV